MNFSPGTTFSLSSKYSRQEAQNQLLGQCPERQPVSAPFVHFCGNLVLVLTLAFLAARSFSKGWENSTFASTPLANLAKRLQKQVFRDGL